jgi:hypothetical protein
MASATIPDVTERGLCDACDSTSMFLGICEACGATMPARPHAPEPLRFTDLVDELGAVAELAARTDATGESVAAACQRLQRLVGSLRSQFLVDIGAALPGAPGMA